MGAESMVTSRCLMITFVLFTLGCVLTQGVALDADDRTTNCYGTCRAANFASSTSCGCGKNTFPCNKLWYNRLHPTELFWVENFKCQMLGTVLKGVVDCPNHFIC